MTDAVFKALADPTRRLLLDRLFAQDGQTLGELAAAVPDMTRFGVMKHLGVLEEAGLVTTAKAGREKHHYLNPVPIGQLHDRWVGKFAAPWTRVLNDLKGEFEGTHVNTLRHHFVMFLGASPQRVWRALTEPAETERWFERLRLQGRLQPGEPIAYRAPDGSAAVTGHVTEIDPGHVLSMTWKPATAPDEPPSRVRWELEGRGDGCRLLLVHDGFASETTTFRESAIGWMPVLLRLKEHLDRRKSVRAV